MDIAVHHASLVREAGADVWHLTCEVTYDDGKREAVGWSIPAETIMWRIGEYNLDPGDVDGALDLIMFGHYLPPGQQAGILTDPDLPAARRKYRADVAARKGTGKLRGIKVAGQKAARVAEPVGGTVRAVSGDADDPLELIRANTAVTADHVKVIQEHTERRRRAIAARRAAQQSAVVEVGTLPTVEALRARLAPPQVEDRPGLARRMPDDATAAIVERMLDRRKAQIQEQRREKARVERERQRAAVVAEAEREQARQRRRQAERVQTRRRQRERDAAEHTTRVAEIGTERAARAAERVTEDDSGGGASR